MRNWNSCDVEHQRRFWSLDVVQTIAFYCFQGMALIGLPLFPQGSGHFNCPDLNLQFSPGFWQLGPAIGGSCPLPQAGSHVYDTFWLWLLFYKKTIYLAKWPMAMYCKFFKSRTPVGGAVICILILPQSAYKFQWLLVFFWYYETFPNSNGRLYGRQNGTLK